MKLYIVGQAPTNFYEEVQDLGFTLLNGTVPNVSKGLIDADIILGLVHEKVSPIIHTHLGVAIGDQLTGKKKKKIIIVITEKTPFDVKQLYAQPYITNVSDIPEAFNLLSELIPKKVNSAGVNSTAGRIDKVDEEFKKNNLYMIRALAATLYSQMSPEHGEPLSLQLNKKDIDKIVEDIAIKAEILEPSRDIALYFTSKGAIPSELPEEE